jgi:uncharacterized protein
MNHTPLATRSTSPLRCSDRGAPAWVDLGTAAGTATAAKFYCGLFGWSVVARHRPLDDSNGYWTFRKGGKDVGGLAPADEATWTVYIAVADVDATACAVADNGGTVLVGPMAVDAGRMAVCADPLGASFVAWQPDRDEDDAVGSSGTSSTSYQLACRDVEAAKRFYGAVFGWDARTTPLAGRSSYTEFLHPGTERQVAGMVAMDSRWRGDLPARWMVHLAVGDTDRTAARATELGGRVTVAPFDLPNVGRLAVIDDPEHAAFSVLQAA